MNYSPAIRCLALLFLLGLTACAGDRPSLVSRPSAIGDLWWNGAFDDSQGRRWNASIVPGVGESLWFGGRAFKRAVLDDAGLYGKAGWWKGGWKTMKESSHFAWSDSLWEFGIKGIGRDYSQTTTDLGSLFEERPFGWIAQTVALPIWGYVLKPACRVVLAPVGAVGGTVVTLATPVVLVVVPPVFGVLDAATCGVVIPVVGMTWTQVSWLASIWNSEPALSQSGRWGLQLITPPTGPTPASTEELLKEAKNAAIHVWNQQKNEKLEQKIKDLSKQVQELRRQQNTIWKETRGGNIPMVPKDAATAAEYSTRVRGVVEATIRAEALIENLDETTIQTLTDKAMENLSVSTSSAKP